jgi:hypothetical protein
MITNFNFAVMQLQEAPYSCGARIELGGGDTAATSATMCSGGNRVRTPFRMNEVENPTALSRNTSGDVRPSRSRTLRL